MADSPNPDVCIIEDDATIAAFLADLLEMEGYRVVLFPDGMALDRAMAAPPRLFLLDLMLPKLDGGEICRRLRAAPRTWTVPIVIMTAAAPALIAQRLFGCDYQAVLRKPFDIEALLGIVERYARGQAVGLAEDEAVAGGGRMAPSIPVARQRVPGGGLEVGGNRDGGCSPHAGRVIDPPY